MIEYFFKLELILPLLFNETKIICLFTEDVVYSAEAP